MAEGTVTQGAKGRAKGTPRIGRRRFLKLAAAVGVVAGATTLGLGTLTGRLNFWSPSGRIGPAIVDYGNVPKQIKSPTLRIAQWYDYWPRRFLDNFRDYIRQKYQIEVTYEQEVYTSNEELFNWITVGNRKYDVMFPSNGMVELMDTAGLIYNLNLEWLPNFHNLFPEFRPGDPTLLPHEWRVVSPSEKQLRAVPYQWGTTGIGVNTKYVRLDDVRAAGWESFLWDTYQLKDGRTIDFRNDRRMTLLNDIREVISLGLKLSGWKEQVGEGRVPTAVAYTRAAMQKDLDAKDPKSLKPSPILDLADYKARRQQWSHDDHDDRLGAVKQTLLDIRPRLLAYETTKQGEYLVQGITYISQGWGGDLLFQARPYAEPRAGRDPIDYVIPRQGSARWIDNAVIHSASQNLWLAHEFINFILDEAQGALITDWGLYGTPNERSFALLRSYPELSEPWDPRGDYRIYLDGASGYDPTTHPEGHISDRLDYQGDVGIDVVQGRYFPLWEDVKY